MVKKITLPNKLRVLLAPMNGTRAVTFLVLVATGSKYETKTINGISHFLEHLFFKGTEKRPGFLDISEEIDSIGGNMNAFTAQEYTGYWIKVDRNHFATALDVIADIFLHSKLDEEEITRERGVIIEEMNMHRDTPMRHVGNLFEEVLYGDQPAGWPIIGSKEVVLRLTRGDFVRYWSTHYTPANTIVCVAGSITLPKALASIKKYFSATPRAKTPRKVNVHVSRKGPRLLVETRNTDQTHICIGFHAFDLFDARRYALGVLSTILGGGMSSRMFVSVRERQGLAYSISTMADQQTDAGALVTQAGVDNAKVDRAIRTILDEYKKIATEHVGPAELKKAKEFIKGHIALELESSDEVALWSAPQELLEGTIRTPEEVFKKIDAVTPAEVRAVARSVCRLENLNVAAIGPFDEQALRPALTW
ncbi:MAG: insulinase family protein [Parcubacteria group bacterium]|nr:insulinase family protein [Parcubacteria group bacterium]